MCGLQIKKLMQKNNALQDKIERLQEEKDEMQRRLDALGQKDEEKEDPGSEAE